MIAVLGRRHPIFFLKYILKISLTGKAQVVADFIQAFIGKGQEAFGFFQLTAHNKTADIKSQLFLKFFEQPGTASSDMVYHIIYLNRLVGMKFDVLYRIKHFL